MALASTYYDFVENIPLVDGEDVEEEEKALLRQQVRDALLAFPLAHSRDVSYLWIGGRYYYGTGGMSWGDSPTDAFDLISLLDGFSLWDEEITDGEVISALLRGKPDAGGGSAAG